MTTRQKNNLKLSLSNYYITLGGYVGENNQINIHYLTSAGMGYVGKQKLLLVFPNELVVEFAILV